MTIALPPPAGDAWQAQPTWRWVTASSGCPPSAPAPAAAGAAPPLAGGVGAGGAPPPRGAGRGAVAAEGAGAAHPRIGDGGGDGGRAGRRQRDPPRRGPRRRRGPTPQLRAAITA